MTRSAQSSGHIEELRHERVNALHQTIRERILVMDGATGTMLRRPSPQSSSPELYQACDLLCLTAPQSVHGLHVEYLAAGADIIKTNSFNACALPRGAFGLENAPREISFAAASAARAAADAVERDGRWRFVAGVIGPGKPRASRSRDCEIAICESTRGLIEGGADLLLIETVTGRAGLDVALGAIQSAFESAGRRLPVMISATIAEDGRLIDGTSVAAFWSAVRGADPFAAGINCAFGPASLDAPIAELARIAEAHVSVHPNTGLPDAAGCYAIGPAAFAESAAEWARRGYVDIVGGCCGTTPAHIRALVHAVAGMPPRRRRI